jgi:hypothetical protein
MLAGFCNSSSTAYLSEALPASHLLEAPPGVHTPFLVLLTLYYVVYCVARLRYSRVCCRDDFAPRGKQNFTKQSRSVYINKTYRYSSLVLSNADWCFQGHVLATVADISRVAIGGLARKSACIRA